MKSLNKNRIGLVINIKHKIYNAVNNMKDKTIKTATQSMTGDGK